MPQKVDNCRTLSTMISLLPMGSCFYLPVQSHEAALIALRHYLLSKKRRDSLEKEVVEAETLAEALECCGWDVVEDDEGNIEDLEFGEFLVNDMTGIFSAIAPFVEAPFKGAKPFVALYNKGDREVRIWYFPQGQMVYRNIPMHDLLAGLSR